MDNHRVDFGVGTILRERTMLGAVLRAVHYPVLCQ